MVAPPLFFYRCLFYPALRFLYEITSLSKATVAVFSQRRRNKNELSWFLFFLCVPEFRARNNERRWIRWAYCMVSGSIQSERKKTLIKRASPSGLLCFPGVWMMSLIDCGYNRLHINMRVCVHTPRRIGICKRLTAFSSKKKVIWCWLMLYIWKVCGNMAMLNFPAVLTKMVGYLRGWISHPCQPSSYYKVFLALLIRESVWKNLQTHFIIAS